jgi:hypothetical protein
MTNTLKTLTRRLIGVNNPYAGYVEACDEACRRWTLEPITSASRRRSYYADFAFQARVETSLKGTR